MKNTNSLRIQKALAVTIQIHGGHKRKGDNNTPYVVHPISVAMLLMHYLRDEDVIIAGLLHDALEDTNYSPADIKKNFGVKVLKFVQEVSDKHPDEPWAKRRNDYLMHIKKASKHVL